MWLDTITGAGTGTAPKDSSREGSDVDYSDASSSVEELEDTPGASKDANTETEGT